jgi:ATP-dependent DNA helicase RecQ
LGNFFQLPVGAGEQQVFPFNLSEFSNRYKLSPLQSMQSIRFIEREGLISWIESQVMVSRLMILVNHETLYDFEFRNPSLEPVIKTILRSYAGVFSEFIPIHEKELSQRLGVSVEKTRDLLAYLDKCGILSYIPATGLPNIYFLTSRQHPDRLPLSKRNYEDRKQAALTRIESILAYIQNNMVCRSVQLVSYFGEKKSIPCGSCDVCIDQKKKGILDSEKFALANEVLQLIESGTKLADDILSLATYDPDKIAAAIRMLIDEDILRELSDGSLQLIE